LAARIEHRLLDDLIRLEEQRLRNRQPECLGRLEVDDKLELRGLLDGEIGRFGPRGSMVSGRRPVNDYRIY
jgi:hypothetical protein